MGRFRFAALLLCALPALAAVSPDTPRAPAAAQDAAVAHDRLARAAGAVVGIKVKALPNARSNATLGAERAGSGVVIAPQGLVLTIGYLILEADQVDVVSPDGRSIPATVTAYDHATGFGLLRPLAPLDAPPIRLGSSASVAESDRVLVAATGGGEGLSVATVVSRRPFAGYWEYLIEGAIFTSPPRADFGGAALIDRDGELVGIGSLFVMDALTPGERLPGNMFIPIDLLKPVLDEMIATGRQKGGIRPWIGLNSVEEDGRLKVIRVSSEGPAEQAGITAGDIVLALNGRKVEGHADFYRRLWAAGAPGVEVTLRILKGVEIVDVRVRSIDRAANARRKPTI